MSGRCKQRHTVGDSREKRADWVVNQCLVVGREGTEDSIWRR